MTQYNQVDDAMNCQRQQQTFKNAEPVELRRAHYHWNI